MLSTRLLVLCGGENEVLNGMSLFLNFTRFTGEPTEIVTSLTTHVASCCFEWCIGIHRNTVYIVNEKLNIIVNQHISIKVKQYRVSDVGFK